MIGLRSKATFDKQRVQRKARDATFRNLGHAAAGTRMTARRLIRRRKKPSSPDSPPHTQTGRLKAAYLYHVTKPYGPAVIGPARSRIGPAAAAHEHGGRFRDRMMPRRPVMGPTLAKVGPKLSSFWAGSIQN